MDSKSDGCSGRCENSEKVGQNMTPATKNEQCSGCGLSSPDKITITVAPTTGGRFEISISQNSTIDHLKKIISKKLRVPKERILLLNKDKQLRAGNLKDHNICDGGTVTLLPSVETGLLSQRPEQGVMQALESLNDSQVNDFLSGKSPLNLTMRLGDHMMLIQLQLSTINPSSSKKSVTTSTSVTSTSTTNLPKNIVITTTNTQQQQQQQMDINNKPSTSTASSGIVTLEKINTTEQKQSVSDSCNDFYSKISNMIHKNFKLKRKLVQKENDEVTKPKKVKNNEEELKPTQNISKLNELLSTNINNSTNVTNNLGIDVSKPTSSNSCVTKSNEPVPSTSSASSCSSTTQVPTQPPPACASGVAVPANGTSCCENKCRETATLDTKALAEASRNLTQTLKQLSSEVLTCRRTETVEEGVVKQSIAPRRRVKATPGAIIESMKHHGKGVFSGTFSGTLNPALQDRFGRPKRDISTIIHILNDLLCATPQYRRSHVPSKQDAQDGSNDVDNLSASGSGMSSVEENEATRGKLEKLRMVMEQNRARRKARREGRLPCSTVWSCEQANDMSTVDEEIEDNPKPDQSELHELTRAEPVTA